jgi:hypothetical protein
MVIPEARSHQLARHLLSLGGSELAAAVAQLHPDDLAMAWQAMSPWECGTIWIRYRAGRSGRRADSNILENVR